VTKELKQRMDSLECKAKKLWKQRLDFPFEKRIGTKDRFLTMQGQKNVKTSVRGFETTDRLFTKQGQAIVEKNSSISQIRKELQQQIDCLQSKVKNC